MDFKSNLRKVDFMDRFECEWGVVSKEIQQVHV